MAGYDYQIDVSVWLAVDLVLVSRISDELVLEPASEEDIEAKLSDSEPSRVESKIAIEDFTLIVQCKRHSGNAWTPTTLRSLLNHGSDKRVPAAKRLEHKNFRYVLVTSAGLNGYARKLKVRKIGSWPKRVPRLIAGMFNHDISGRLAVVANEDDERLSGDIDQLLASACRVPNVSLDDCKKKLRDDAHARVRGAGGGRWRRADIERVIYDHGGYIASDPDLKGYVYPTNWADVRAKISERSAAILIGKSGTGKTLATKMLFDELRKDHAGLTQVPIQHGPGELFSNSTPSPVLFDIEDPWGRFDFDPKSRPWNDQLATAFTRARPNRMIIATSRLDVAMASQALETVKPWIVTLEAENYQERERKDLYTTRIPSLPRDLQELARNAEEVALEKLETPLEIQKFFDALRTANRNKVGNRQRFVNDAINSAHRSAIEGTVIQQIEERKDVRAAAVLWSLLAANEKLSRLRLRQIEEGLYDIDPEMERGVSPLVDFFVAARNLRQTESGMLTYYHPRVEAGIVRAICAERLVTRKTILNLIDLLTTSPDAEWGAGTAARIVSRANEVLSTAHEPHPLPPRKAAARKIDAWLEAQLVSGERPLDAMLELAARAGSSESNASEIARYLLWRMDKSTFSMDFWHPPGYDEAWYSARLADTGTTDLLDAFIRKVLPKERTYYPESFAKDVVRLSAGLTPAFLDAAKQIVEYGYIPSHSAIAAGALNDLDAFESVLDTAAQILTPTPESAAEWADTQLDIINDVFSDDYAQHIGERDDGLTAAEFISAYVRRLRQERGWSSLMSHRHFPRLLSDWLRAIVDEAQNAPPDKAELAAAISAAYGSSNEEHVWRLLVQYWDVTYLPRLRTALLQGGREGRIEDAALVCLLTHAPTDLSVMISQLHAASEINRAVEIAMTLARVLHSGWAEYKACKPQVLAAISNLSMDLQQVCAIEGALLDYKTPPDSPLANATLRQISSPSPPVRRLRLQVDEYARLPVEGDVRWALAESDESSTCTLAVKAAIRHGMQNEIEQAMAHRFAHAAGRAIEAHGMALDAPVPATLLAFVEHRASPVRLALANVLKSKPHPSYVPTLMILAKDRWSKRSTMYGEDEDLPIAQAAADALIALAPHTAEHTEELFAIGKRTTDPDLRSKLFELLAGTGDAQMHEKLFAYVILSDKESQTRSAVLALIFDAPPSNAANLASRVTLELLRKCREHNSAALALLLGAKGEPSYIETVAKQVAVDKSRRVLLLLMIWTLRERNADTAVKIAAMLPQRHSAVDWAMGNSTQSIDDRAIADLGDPMTCKAVLHYASS